MHNLIQLYTEWKGCAPKHTEILPKAGSNRHYVRLTDDEGRTVIGVVGADIHENRCFINLSRHFLEKGLSVPEILAVSTDETCYLQTDLGGVSLYQTISHGRENNGAYEETEVELLKRTIRLLPHLQVEGAQGLNFDSLLS
ncbi:MAG: phosphotransferase, partial [Bacteroidaceae bacterium]|nr:phosphotransferase [Bacteroidaceae bacterium]